MAAGNRRGKGGEIYDRNDNYLQCTHFMDPYTSAADRRKGQYAVSIYIVACGGGTPYGAGKCGEQSA